MSSPAPSDDLFARARKADIEAVAGVRLFRAGRRLRGECPLCGASKGKRADGAFSVDPQGGLFKCFGCDAGGDVIELERRLGGGSPREAAERLAGPGFVPRIAPAAVRPAPGPDTGGAGRTAARLWREARPAEGSAVALYLAARGIGGRVLELALQRLKYHPGAFWGVDEATGQRVLAPAMVAQVRSPRAVLGVHATYLSADGRRKSQLRPAKKMWGRQSDAEGAIGGVWLTPTAAGVRGGPLVVAEGIESALSAALLLGAPCRVAAALSLGRLQGGLLKDRWGRIDPAMVASDPERPAFTWPSPERSPFAPVWVAVDRDMSAVRVRARRAAGGSYERELSADERAGICAGLAAAAWRRAGAADVRTMAPAAGRDFNDELLARGAA